uniref:Vacuolar protein sorting-associated protein 54 n=1 Tax=Kalmanozyma brasiliensis (strain GHG001) TaxID=1365824 RepID=V5EJY0_KALBG
MSTGIDEAAGSSSSSARPADDIASTAADETAGSPRKRLPNLSAVPQVFFSEDFDLGNPYTFDQVTERYKVASSSSPTETNDGSSPTYDVALNQMLQEKLSYYSDVIEQHLIIEIGQQSSSFFAALENLNDLNAEAESCLLKIDELKSELDSIDEKQAKKGLRVIREQQHRRQLERKQVAVRDVRQVIERRDLVRLLLQQGETEEALDLLDKLRSTLRRAEDQPAPTATGVETIPRAGNRVAPTDSGIVLSDLQGLASVPAQLEEMEQTLSGMLEQDLTAVLKLNIEERLSTFRQSGASSSPSDTNGYFKESASEPGPPSLNPNAAIIESPLTPSKPPLSPFGHSARALSSSESVLASRIGPLVIGLAKTGGIEKAVSTYRDVAIQAVQEAWRETLSHSGSEMIETVRWLLSEESSKLDGHDNLPAPAARIRDLDHAAFLGMCRQLFDTLMECLKAIDAQCKLVPRILDGLAARTSSAGSTTVDTDRNLEVGAARDGSSSGLPLPPIMPPGVPTNLPAKLSDVVVASAEKAHGLCARLLSLRATTHAALELPPFLVVFQLCWSFVLSSEQLCRKMIVGLRGTILGQAKGFLANFHRRRIERAAKAVEEETWAQADVGAEIQDQIRQIVSSAVEDPSKFVVTGGGISADSGNAKEATSAQGDDAGDDGAPALAKTLDIEDRPYFVVQASLDVLALLVDYLKVIINLPLLTTEAMARVVEFLKQFNSRTCQVVLGAGAMRSAGLKNITAKHLALASQSLSVMISLIPYIRETVRRHLSPKQAVMLTEFDKLRRDFQEHQYEIHAKLVAIMSDRLTVHCRTLSGIDWNADKSAAEGQENADSKDIEPNKYAVDLVKETATLHKVLSKYLQGVVVEHVIGQVLRAIDDRIAQEFDKMDVSKQQAVDRMQADVRYLGTKLSVLKHVEWKDEALQQVMASKHVVPPAPVNASATAGTSAGSNELPPGSPALDKTGASQFGPVTYKPRIPNIFARRQQQQQSQTNSPRASTDVARTSTPMESQKSLETTPRSSLQIQQQPPAGSENGTTAEPQQAHESGPQTPAKSAATGARSIAEEVDDVPPATPSKGQETGSSIIVKDEDADAEGAEDLVAPVVPAPEAVAKLLGESSSTSSDAPAAASSDGDATAARTETEATAEASQCVEELDGQGAKAVSGEQQQEGNAKAGASDAAVMDDTSEAVKNAREDRASVQPKDAPAAPSEAAQIGGPPQFSTPQKDARGFNPSLAQSAVIGTPSEASPVRSGASTPIAPATPKTPTGTAPSKPGRMSLKERLAEAARKRAQQSAPLDRSGSQVEPRPTAPVAPAPSAPDETPAKEGHNEVKGDPTAHPPESKDSTAETTEASQTVSASDATAAPTDEAAAAVAAKDADASDAKPVVEQGASLERSANAHRADNGSVEEKQDVARTQETPDGGMSDKAATVETTAPTLVEAAGGATRASAEEAADVASSTPAAKAAAGAEIDTTPSTVDGTEAPEGALKIATPGAEVSAERDGDGDEADGDGDAEADTNEGTNDSAVGGGSGAGGKKNKKKKKKGKKK